MSKDLEVLPIGWCKSKIKDIFSIEYGRSLVRDFRNENGPYPVIGSSGIVGYHDSYLVEGPSVVIGRKGSVGSITLLKDSSWPIDTVYFVQSPVQINIKFVYYQLLTLRLEELDRSTTIPGLNRNDLYNVDFLLCPESEQNLIVEKLEELLSDLDKGVAELKTAQEKLNQYRQTLLKSAVEGTLTKEWREEKAHKITETGEQLLARILKERRARWEKQKIEEFGSKGQTPPKNWKDKYPEPIAPDTSELPKLPEGWVWACIDQLVEIGTGVTPLKSRSDYYKGGNVPWITSGAVNDEVVTSSNSYITETALEECGLTTYPIGTLLVAMYGEGKTRGKCSELRIPATINQALAALVFNGVSEKIKDFIKIVLMNDYQKMRSRASGAAQPNLNLLIMRSLCVPLPSIEEQTTINNIVNQKKKEIDLQSLSIDSTEHMLNEQRKNILKDAFSGKLVEQNINDEPVSVLLERIKFERQARDNLPKPKKPKKVKEKSISMKTLSEVLKAKGEWVSAQDAFEACGVGKDTDTDRIEEIYAELRLLDKAGKLLTKRQGNYDMIKLKDI